MRIGELASRTRTAASAIRYYEAEGLLPGSSRSQNGYRDYQTSAVGRVEFIRRAQALGLRIAQIRQLVSGPAGSRDEERQRLRHAVAHQLAERASARRSWRSCRWSWSGFTSSSSARRSRPAATWATAPAG